jgi:hypothetical protein
MDMLSGTLFEAEKLLDKYPCAKFVVYSAKVAHETVVAHIVENTTVPPFIREEMAELLYTAWHQMFQFITAGGASLVAPQRPGKRMKPAEVQAIEALTVSLQELVGHMEEEAGPRDNNAKAITHTALRRVYVAFQRIGFVMKAFAPSVLCGAVQSGHVHFVQLLIEHGSVTDWPRECVALLKQHPDVIIMLFQSERVPRALFAQHAREFEHQIVAFLAWQQQVRRQLYETCFLPHELCSLISSY